MNASSSKQITIIGAVWVLCIGCFVSGAVTASIIWWAFK